jgi:hypothetical protein
VNGVDGIAVANDVEAFVGFLYGATGIDLSRIFWGSDFGGAGRVVFRRACGGIVTAGDEKEQGAGPGQESEFLHRAVSLEDYSL